MDKKEETEKQKVNFREFLSIATWALKLYVSINPFYTVVTIITSAVLDLRDLVNAFIFAKTIDALITATKTPGATIYILAPYLGVIVAVGILSSALRYINSHADSALQDYARPRLRERLYTKLKDLGIQTLEQPEVNNKINRANETIFSLGMYLNNIVDLISSIVRLISSIIVVAASLPILIPILLINVIPGFFIDKKYRAKLWKWGRDHTEDQRQAGANWATLTDKKDLLEVIVINAFSFISDKYLKFMLWFSKETIAIRKRWYILGFLNSIASNLTLGVGFILVFQRLLSKAISVGDVTFQLRIISSLQDSFFSVINRINQLSELSLRLTDMYELFMTEPAVKDGSKAMSKLTLGPTISFQNVSFKYPNADKYVFRDLNLNLKSGEKVAIVGPNGAGKTTLVKLLCRFYALNQGQIAVNGYNLTDIKIDSLYQNMGVLFQEYNTYPQLSVKENIFIGRADKRLDQNRVEEAAKSADAIKFIEDYKTGFDQILSESYKGGIRPSTGQWQKLAIARFFYRNAPLVIFDEPTASIDAVSEYNIFNRIYDFFKGKTVIIISHRFSTVRNADRIIVIQKGKIVEEGSHTELMSLGGEYAKAFNLQAEGYNDSEVT